MANLEFVALQMNTALQKMVKTLPLTDSEAMEVADLYESWKHKLDSKQLATVGERLTYGVNDYGETQLYEVLQEHQPQADWTPDLVPSMYKKVGFDGNGVPIWTKPLGSGDSYDLGDTVSFEGELWDSTVDGNVWQPGVYGWVKRA